MAFELRDCFETTDGARPEARPLDERQVAAHPLLAFGVLAGGDVLELGGEGAGAEGLRRAQSYLGAKVEIVEAKAPPDVAARVRTDLVRQLQHNPSLVGRLDQAKALEIVLVQPGRDLTRHGFPRNVAPSVAGVFWDQPGWARARIALRLERLAALPELVFHEVAHAVHYLAFSAKERALIYDFLRPTFGSRAAMDEVFAIYSERELLGAFARGAERAPGIYGHTRRRWDENHVFTRFVRKLYFPHRGAAGPRLAPEGRGGGWMHRLGGR